MTGRFRRAFAARAAARRERLIFATCAEVGPGCRIHGNVTINGGANARLGANVHIGANAYIRAAGGLVIGDNTMISRNLVLYTTNHNYRGQRLPYDDERVAKPVTIGRNVWIGMNVSITPGSTIGDGAVIGLGTVVHGTIPPLAVIAAAPWTQVGERDPADYDRLDQARSYGDTDGNPIT